MHCLHSVIRFSFKTNKQPKCSNLHGKINSQGNSWQTQLHHPFSQGMPFSLPCSSPRTGSANHPSTHCSSLAGEPSPLQLAQLVSHSAQWLSSGTSDTTLSPHCCVSTRGCHYITCFWWLHHFSACSPISPRPLSHSRPLNCSLEFRV